MPAPYEGSHQQYHVVREDDQMVPMRDGVCLATDLYFPALGGSRVDERFPVVLERTPYDKRSPQLVANGKYFARRGYVCAIQDVRGRLRSEGEWYPFAHEAPDGYDTVEWLGVQPWCDGQVGTMGQSYSGSDQSALATLDPPHLTTMIVAVGASNYYHSSMRHNGALEQRFHVYAFRMAVNSKEAASDLPLKDRLVRAFTEEMTELLADFPLQEGDTLLRRLPSYERWAVDIATHGDYDDYWKQRGYAISDYYEEHADVPTLHIGGWYDSYARNTCESYMALSKVKRSDQRLLMGPWTHGMYEATHAGDVDFGIESATALDDLRLAWFDHYLKDMRTKVTDWSPVWLFTMGAGDGTRVIQGTPGQYSEYPGRVNHGGYWRNESDWPLPGTAYTPFYLHGDGSLSTSRPQEVASSSPFTFEPTDPVPTVGGGISAADEVMRPGAFDQRGRPDFVGCKDTLPLSSRSDVLSFETPALQEDTEVTGPIEMHLWAASSAVDTDFTAKLVDVHPTSDDYPQGVAINITDSIIRARYRNGWEKTELMKPGEPYEFVFQLYPTSNIFRRSHRIRLDISSSNWPRFDVNPNTGGPLGVHQPPLVARQTVYHEAQRPSNILLPLQIR